jgi:hypothetical protein
MTRAAGRAGGHLVPPRYSLAAGWLATGRWCDYFQKAGV